MKQQLKNMLFDYTNKTVIEDGSFPEGTNLNYVLSINKNLNNLGFTLDMKTMRKLSTNSLSQLKDFYEGLITTIKNNLGIDEFTGTPLFYANFPDEVMKKSDMELYFNALIYYSFSQTNDPDMTAIAEQLHSKMTEEKKERLPLTADMPENPKLIAGTDKYTIDRLVDSMIHGLALNEQGFRDVCMFAELEPERFTRILESDKPFGSKEILVKLANYYYKNGNDNYVSLLLKDSMDVVRFAACISEGNDDRIKNDITLAVMPRFNLKKRQETYIKNLLANCENLEHDMWASKKSQAIFKRLSKSIHPDHGNSVTVKAFDNLINGHKPGLSLTARIEAINNIEDNGEFASKLALFAEHFSGVFLRNVIAITENAESKGRTDSVVKAVQSVHDVPVLMLLKARDLIKKRDSFDIRSFRLKNGKTFSTENRELALSEDSKNKLTEALNAVASNEALMYRNTEDTVYIDPVLKDIKAPERSMRNANGRATLASYSLIHCNKDKNLIILGVYWKNGKERIDVDLSATAYKEDFSDSQSIAYYNLRNTFGLHSGDYTTAPNGATEAVLIDKKQCRKAGYRYIFANVYSFTHQNFNEIPDVRFISQERNGDIHNLKMTANQYGEKSCFRKRDDESGEIIIDGKVFEPSCFENNISLTANATQEIVFVYDVIDDTIIWLDKINIMNGIINGENNSARLAMLQEVAYMKNNAIPSLYETFEITGVKFTDDPIKADRLYLAKPVDAEKEGLKENAEIVTAMELSKIQDEYLDKPKKPVEKTVVKKEANEESDVNVLLRLIREISNKN